MGNLSNVDHCRGSRGEPVVDRFRIGGTSLTANPPSAVTHGDHVVAVADTGVGTEVLRKRSRERPRGSVRAGMDPYPFLTLPGHHWRISFLSVRCPGPPRVCAQRDGAEASSVRASSVAVDARRDPWRHPTVTTRLAPGPGLPVGEDAKCSLRRSVSTSGSGTSMGSQAPIPCHSNFSHRRRSLGCTSLSAINARADRIANPRTLMDSALATAYSTRCPLSASLTEPFPPSCGRLRHLWKQIMSWFNDVSEYVSRPFEKLIHGDVTGGLSDMWKKFTPAGIAYEALDTASVRHVHVANATGMPIVVVVSAKKEWAYADIGATVALAVATLGTSAPAGLRPLRAPVRCGNYTKPYATIGPLAELQERSIRLLRSTVRRLRMASSQMFHKDRILIR